MVPVCAALMWHLTHFNMSVEEYRRRPEAERTADLAFLVRVVLALPYLCAVMLSRAWLVSLRQGLRDPLSLKPVRAAAAAPSLGLRLELCVHRPWTLALAYALPPLLVLLVGRALLALLRARWSAFLGAWACPRKPREVQVSVEFHALGLVQLDARASVSTSRR